jgi:aminocarboxymuconate-semialdehyde decarboxylase
MKSFCCGIDTHAHVIPEHFPSYLGSAVPTDWPSMAPAHECHKNVMIAGKNYRTVSDKCWDTQKRVADMPSMGLALQVVSPMPELLSYWMEAKAAQQLLRYTNDQIAVMVAESNGALLGLGAVPLQDMDMAMVDRLAHPSLSRFLLLVCDWALRCSFMPFVLLAWIA